MKVPSTCILGVMLLHCPDSSYSFNLSESLPVLRRMTGRLPKARKPEEWERGEGRSNEGDGAL